MEDLLFLLFYALPLFFFVIGVFNLYKYVSEKRRKRFFEGYRNQPDKERLVEKYLNELNINIDTSNLSSEQRFIVVEKHFQTRINRRLTFSITSIFLFIILSAFEYTTLSFRNALNAGNPQVELERLVKGKIAYDIPDTMKLEKDYRATVSITQSQNDSVLLESLNSADFEIEQITISSRVKASLVDPTNINFDINPLSSEEQLVDDSTNTTWRWNIRPKKSGKNVLMLKVSIKIKNRIGETPKDILVFDKPFFVESSITTEAKNIFSKYWQWFMTALIIPIFLWLRNIYITRKNNKKNKREPIGFKKSGT